MKNGIINKIQKLESEIKEKQQQLNELKSSQNITSQEYVNRYFKRMSSNCSTITYIFIKKVHQIDYNYMEYEGLSLHQRIENTYNYWSLTDGTLCINMLKYSEISKEEFLSQFKNCCKLSKELVNKYINEP